MESTHCQIVGGDVGFDVGDPVGVDVGDPVGEIEGDTDGLLVGVFVGEVVGITGGHLSSFVQASIQRFSTWPSYAPSNGEYASMLHHPSVSPDLHLYF